jgi:transcription initiation factor TFIIIB Brf1 subunit/transcription initiation factor TFIIB
MNCPKCHEIVSFLNDEDTKVCKNCGEVISNTKSSNYIKKEDEDANRRDESGDRSIH